MSYGFSIEVWGEYACFSRPELKTERVSYDVITPSAARGLIESIFWKPAITVVIDKILVINKIEFTNIRRNEVKKTISSASALSAMKKGTSIFLSTKKEIQQRGAMILKNPRYVIDFHFELTNRAGATDTVEKFAAMFERRITMGKNFRQPCFGMREFTAHFKMFDGQANSAYQGQVIDLGIMQYDLDYSNPRNITQKFFHAVMRDGVIDLRNVEVLT